MPDPSLIGIAAGKVGAEAAEATSGLISRLLGPAADQIGLALGRYTEYRVGNLKRIVVKAEGKSRTTGEIPPRVAHRLLEEGSYCDDELMAEYLSGVLAASRTPSGRDDRAIAWSELLTGMSTLQVRAHFLLYREWSRVLHGHDDLNLGVDEGRRQAQLLLPLAAFAVALAGDSSIDFGDALSHTIPNLSRLGLISERYGYGTREQASVPDSPFSPLLRVEPSVAGVELYGWCLGFPGLSPTAFVRLAEPITGLEGLPDALQGVHLPRLKAVSSNDGAS